MSHQVQWCESNIKEKWNKELCTEGSYFMIHRLKKKKLTASGENHTHAHAMWVKNWKRDGYPKLSLREECAFERSEEEKSGMGSMGWKEAWYIWEEWGATVAPTELGKQEDDKDKEDRDWGFRLEVQMIEGCDTAEERGGRGRQSSWPIDWLRDCMRVALDGYGVPSPCCPAKRQLSTNLWEPVASWGSMCRWRRDIILGAVGTKQHYKQPLKIKSDGQGETDREISGKILRCWDTILDFNKLKTWVLKTNPIYQFRLCTAHHFYIMWKSQQSRLISPPYKEIF